MSVCPAATATVAAGATGVARGSAAHSRAAKGRSVVVEVSGIRQRLARGFGVDRRGDQQLTYIPALDGIRAFAVLSVMAFHGGLNLPGGFLGVDTFFVLSGFLITTLLVAEWRRRGGTIRLGAFWARRARRLLPALLVVLLFVAFYVGVVAGTGSYPALRLDALSTLFYVANWHFILTGANYFNQTGPVSPLTHTWSLAIEEQFYLVWPLVVLGVLGLTRSIRALFWVCVAGALASAVEMGILFNRGASTTRLYYGTDTHAQCLLVGAALALALVMIADRRRATGWVAPVDGHGPPIGGDPAWVAVGSFRTAMLWTGLLGVLGTAILWGATNGDNAFLYEGGFMVAALLTAAVIASVVCAQRELVALALAWTPLRFLGRISYGVYLWHFPLFLWIDNARTGLTGVPLWVVRTVITVVVATASFYLVEQPIRQGTFFRDWRAWLATPAAAVLVVIALISATVAPAQAVVGVKPPTGEAGLYQGRPVRVLMLGDSTALTLGIGLLGYKNINHAYDITTLDEGILGCGVADGEQVRVLGVTDQVNATCQPATPASRQWTADDQGWVDSFRPNVVAFLAGRWEVADRTYNGQWTSILNPTFQGYLRAEMQQLVSIASSRGAKVVLFTAPCYSSGEQPDGTPWPEDQPARVQAYNSIVRQVAAANPTTTTVFDLYSLVCPHGQYSDTLGDVMVRSSDGVHFTIPGGEYLAHSILPVLVAQGRDAIAASSSASTSTSSLPSP
jgi:peptidoglycan/LPS O-acetylase OafA/YrhL